MSIEIDTENTENDSTPPADSADTPRAAELENADPAPERGREPARRGRKPKDSKKDKGKKVSGIVHRDAPERPAPLKNPDEIEDTGSAINATVDRLQALIDRHREKFPNTTCASKAVNPFDEVATKALAVEPIPPALCALALSGVIDAGVVTARIARGANPMPPNINPKVYKEPAEACSEASKYLPPGTDFGKYLAIMAAAVAVAPLVGLVVAEATRPGCLGYRALTDAEEKANPDQVLALATTPVQPEPAPTV